MSIQTQHPGASATLAARPVVVPTRRRLDRRFASLGLTITTTAPWVEVLLATDPGLFDPSRADARTDATFYASRTHGGLTPTTSGRARYVAPAAVVARLAAAGGALWYLAVAHEDATGRFGVASAPSGASGAVTVDPSFARGRVPVGVAAGLARGLTVGLAPVRGTPAATDRLDGEDGANLHPGASGLPQAPSAAPLALMDGDRLEGEDGADLAIPTPLSPVGDGGDRRAAPGSRSTAPVSPPPADAVMGSGTTGPAPLAPSGLSLDDYDDGWDDLEPGSVPALASAALEPDLGEEYPDIDWTGVLDDPYGRVPDHRSLDAPPPVGAQAPAAPAAAPSTPGAAPAPSSPAVALPPGPPALALGAETQRRIIEATLGRDDSSYATVVADGAFRGRFGPGHKAYQRYHTGLSYGTAEFSQDSGSLGQLLRLMVDREPDTFQAVFGPAWQELLAVTTAPGPSGEHVEGGRGPRVQPVDGADLWEEPWLSRFRAAGAVPAFRAAQNQLAAELHLVPMLGVAAGFGLTSERALCMVVDRAVALGEQGAKRWIADTVGPAGTPALRQAALAALGLDSIEAFQASVPGLLVDGEFGPMTHATLTAALRGLGPASPLPLPDVGQMVAAMVRRAESEQGSARLVRLAGETTLGDTPIGAQP